MNTTTRTCLFGGTMIAAGITSPALAGNFVVGTNFHGLGFSSGAYAYVYRLDVGGGFDFDSQTGPAAGDSAISATITGDAGASNTASVTLNALELSIDASKSDGSSGFSFADTETDFTIDASMSVQVNWSVDTGVSGANRVFQILDLDANSVVFDYQNEANPASGSASVALNAGTNYQFVAVIRSLNGNGGGSFSALVPAPGAVALLGVAGLGAMRRRR